MMIARGASGHLDDELAHRPLRDKALRETLVPAVAACHLAVEAMR